MCQKIDRTINEVAQECYDYMSTDEGKDTILNPKNYTPILEKHRFPKVFAEEIKFRVSLYVQNHLQSTEVLRQLEDINEEINRLNKTVSDSLLKMESKWMNTPIDIRGNLNYSLTAAKVRKSNISNVGVMVATSPLWIPLVIASAPVIIPTLIYMNRSETKKRDIELEYASCKDSIRNTVCNDLQSSFGEVALHRVKTLTQELLPKQIQSLEKMVYQLSLSRTEILSSQDLLGKLAIRLKTIEKTVNEIQKYLAEKNIY